MFPPPRRDLDRDFLDLEVISFWLLVDSTVNNQIERICFTAIGLDAIQLGKVPVGLKRSRATFHKTSEFFPEQELGLPPD